MALFKKKTTTTNIPELQEYYANQQKESAGKAWLLAIGSLLLTVLILVGAIFGGRWLYRQVTKKDDTKKATVVQTDKKSNTTSTNDKTTSSSPATTVPSTSSTSSSTSTTQTPATSSSTAQGVATTQSAATNTAATAASTTNSNLPDTGAGNTIAIFVTVLLVSYVVHRSITLRKLNK